MPSLSGLSGFDAESIVTQLMAIERNPLVRVTQKIKTEQSRLSMLGTSKNYISNIRTAALELTKDISWKASTVTSSSTAATATAGVTPQPGTVTFTVDSLASTLVKRSTASFASVDDVASTSTGKTLAQIVDDINTNTSMTAEAVSDGAGGFVLQVTAAASGAAETVDLSSYDVDGGTSVHQAGSDAQITVTSGTHSEVKTSSTNTFSGLISGVSVTVNAVSFSEVTVTSAASESTRDALATKIQSLVNALNTSLSDIKKQTGYDSVTGTAGPLAGEPALRRAGNLLRDALLGTSTSPSALGITVDRNGVFSFDRTVFEEKFNADPAGVKAALAASTTGFASRLAATAGAISNGSTSLLGAAEQARQNLIRRYDRDVDKLELRLEKRETAIRKTYTNLETALKRLQGQSDWLSSQAAAANKK